MCNVLSILHVSSQALPLSTCLVATNMTNVSFSVPIEVDEDGYPKMFANYLQEIANKESEDAEDEKTQVAKDESKEEVHTKLDEDGFPMIFQEIIGGVGKEDGEIIDCEIPDAVQTGADHLGSSPSSPSLSYSPVPDSPVLVPHDENLPALKPINPNGRARKAEVKRHNAIWANGLKHKSKTPAHKKAQTKTFRMIAKLLARQGSPKEAKTAAMTKKVETVTPPCKESEAKACKTLKTVKRKLTVKRSYCKEASNANTESKVHCLLCNVTSVEDARVWTSLLDCKESWYSACRYCRAASVGGCGYDVQIQQGEWL